MKAALYCRLSEEDTHKRQDTDDSESIQNQKSMLIDYAHKQQWEIYGIYSDEDYAGADRTRPAFNRLLTDAKHRRFDIVLCKTQSRFTRELELVEKYIHGLFPLWGIRFVSIVDNADTQNKGNKKARQINGLINEWYLEDLSDNIKSVLTHKRKNGMHIGSFALYGYKKDPNRKGHLLVDEQAACVVRQVFTLFADGYGKTAIARMLNERGVPNPTQYKQLSGIGYKQPKSKIGTLWKYSAISRMLTNELYIGHMVQGRYTSISYKTKENKPVPSQQWIRVENTHQPIIEKQLWDTVQALLAQKAKPFIGGKIGMFANKVVCMHCGCTLRSSKNRGKQYLKCATKQLARDACPGAFVSVEALEKAVIQELKLLVGEYLDEQLLAELAKEPSEFSNLKALREQQAAYQKKQEQIAGAIKTLYRDRLKGIISEGEFVELAEEFRREQQGINLHYQYLTEEINKEEQQTQPTSPLEEALRCLFAKSLTRPVVDQLIDKVYLGRRTPDTKVLPLEICWRF